MDHAHADTAPHASPTSGGAFGQASSAETFAEPLHDFLIRVDASGARQMLLENEIEDVATLRMASKEELTAIGLKIGTVLKIVNAFAGACSSPCHCSTCLQSFP